MKVSVKTTNTIKHDLKNHLSAIYTSVQNEEKENSYNEKVFSVTLFMYIELSESNGC